MKDRKSSSLKHEQALLKLLKKTVFIVRKHWAHTLNYEDVIKFVGIVLKDEVQRSYLEIEYSNKNTAYLSANTANQFMKCINDWMLNQTLCIIRKCCYLTIMLDDSTDESNQLELSLIARIVRECIIENHFLDSQHLPRCDTSTIFSLIEKYLEIKKLKLITLSLVAWMAAQQWLGSIMV